MPIYLGTLLGDDNNYYKPIMESVNRYIITDYSYRFSDQINDFVISGSTLFVASGTYIYKLDLNDLRTTASASVNYSGTIKSLAVQGNYIFAGGDTINTVRKYNISDLSYVGETPSYGGVIRQIKVNSTHIFAVGETTNTIRKYDISDLTLTSESAASYITVLCLDITDDYVFSHYNDSIYASAYKYIRKYNISDLTLAATSSSLNNTVHSICCDNTHVYYKTSVGSEPMSRLLQTTLANDGSTAINTSGAGNTPNSLCVTTDKVFCGSYTQYVNVKSFDKSTLDYERDFEVFYSGSPRVVKSDDSCIFYATGYISYWYIIKAPITTCQITSYVKV